jgi:hypothetical protein
MSDSAGYSFEDLFMLDHIGIKVAGDWGQLAEIMLFYDKVTLFFIDEVPLRNLFQQVHPKKLIPFLDEHKDRIRLRYFSKQLYQEGFGGGPNYFTLFISNEKYGGREEEPYLDYLSRTLALDTPDGSTINKRLVNRLLNLIEPAGADEQGFINIIHEPEIAREELNEFVKEYVNIFHPESVIPPNAFCISSVTSHIYAGVKVGFNFGGWVPDRVSESHLREAVFYYFRVMSEIRLWSSLSAEFLTTENETFAIRQKVNKLMSRRSKSQHVIDQFQDIFIPDARSIKEVINNGTKTFNEFLGVYEKGAKFREWVKNLPPNADLLKEYYRSVISNDWIDKLPTKSIRWIIFTGIGLGLDALGAGGLGSLSGVGLGAFDTFLFDKILKGWKPNQFINEGVSKFVHE